MVTQRAYLDYVFEAAQDTPDYLERSIASWRASFDPHNALFGYAACGGPAAAAALDAFLYAQTGERRYAEQARAALLRPRELTSIFPAEIAARHPEYHRAVPPMDGLFVPPHYIPAYEQVRDSGVLSAQDHDAIAAIVADSLHTLFHFPEWGAHNRTMLRALSLTLAARAFPTHPEAAAWRDLAAQLAADSWGRWSIEDAMGYHAVWWLALCTYAEATGQADFYRLPATYYYFNYFARMFTPLDTFPDFGDCNWGGGAERLLPCFEKAATVYREPAFKYIADRMFTHMRAAGPPTVGNALLCIQAYAWADDAVPAAPPTWESDEILDDLVGKKILFRSGWTPTATYMLLNYRDEVGYGYIPRRYLRTTLAVSAEKMHHGHADENAVVLLVDQGAALLHEGGYRDNVPNGRYRADIYHNRVIWRPGIKRADVGAWDFLHDDGSYKLTRTQKLHFARFQDVEFSRTQVVDDDRGIAWERVVVYLKPLGCFALVDAVRARKSGPFTLANILYTTDILANGNGGADNGIAFFDTAIRAIGPWQNPQHRALLIAYPLSADRPVLVEQTRRHYQQETGLYQIWTGHLTQGDIVPFVTVLWPHDQGAAIAPLVEALTLLDVSHPGRSLALQIKTAAREITFGCKLDLDLGLLTQETRPRYSFAAGRVRYGDFETDATHFYASSADDTLRAGFTEATRLTHGQRVLYDGPPHRMFQEDGTNNSITPTWREHYECAVAL